PAELQARIKSHLRRQTIQVDTVAKESKNSDIVVADDKRVITFKGEVLQLTAAEYEILSYLVKKEGGVVSREELIYNCEAINEESANKSIDVIVGRIRNKLGENPKTPKYIHAVRGIGYKFLK
ncbi:MAG: helix-turn-helix domain-containing protein, partial [Campylobacteraceae bacterium]